MAKKILPKRSIRDPNILRLLKMMLPYRKWIYAAAAALAVTAGTSSIIAMLLGKLTDMGFYDHNPNVIYWAPAALLGIALLHGSSTFLSGYCLQAVSQSVMIDLREMMIGNVLYWPESVFQKYSTGKIISKFLYEASNALSGASGLLTLIIRDVLQIAALMCLLIYQDWKLTAVTLVMAPLIAVILRWVSRRMRQYTKMMQGTIGEMSASLFQLFDAHKVVKIYGAQEFEKRKFSAVSEKFKRLNLMQQKVAGAGTPLIQLVTMGAVAVVLVVALLQAQAGRLTMGQFTTYLAALLLLMPAIRHLSGLNGSLAKMGAAADSIFDMLSEPLERETGSRQLSSCRGDIEFRGVSLRYGPEARGALEDFSLKVKPGEKIALVGPSGAGKSTVINLIPRFWEPDSGSILIDGVDVRDYTLRSLRSQIALVSQEVVIFDDTIAANIAYGRPDASMDEIRRAAQAAFLTDLIEELPEGLLTRVGEAGSKLSGGQRQRISIARALLKNAPILLLDEATSALDTDSEKYIESSLERLMGGRTVFVVAHRLSTIRDADRIVVLDKGRICETGTHEQLLALGGLYAHLYNIQFKDGIGVAAAAG
ncbi:lipid A export permease/ATP-binding protein MsbA [Mesosutterella sp. OilRF-GAM-744-9]|uniref:Lipid A export permease/ATP-binding protein MsbA n=1 Tax=Mesosutterella porci TaxID=2915351 RepID=A0ABS9MSP2_9BURK|nr:lipid A export permease/ATP-binding protein MsbA [Mesosutterella sp. oilRF-744-WT-GAM-9]MCG5031641.1 lipid A export permease/ATP-binding protein MsbA [Mesosutterella sp. oilRF-744-WT-GAM-9]